MSLLCESQILTTRNAKSTLLFPNNRELLDGEGWLHTGDLARFIPPLGHVATDRESYIRVTGRLKELLITAGGKNVAPAPLEDAVREEAVGVVSNAMVVGDGRRFLTCLITLRAEVDQGQSC